MKRILLTRVPAELMSQLFSCFKPAVVILSGEFVSLSLGMFVSSGEGPRCLGVL